METVKNRVAEHLILDLDAREKAVKEREEAIKNYYDNRQYHRTDNRQYHINIDLTFGSYNSGGKGGVGVALLVVMGLAVYMFVQFSKEAMVLFN